ncbi:hypothetical protein ABG067_000845 [Albugo candida]
MQVFNSKRIKPQTDQIKTINTPLPPAIFPSYENSSLRINSHPTSGSRLALSESLQTTQLSDTGISEDAKNCRVRPVAQRLYSSSTMGVQPTVFSGPSGFCVSKKISDSHEIARNTRIKTFVGHMAPVNEILQSSTSTIPRYPIPVSVDFGTIMHSVPSHNNEFSIEEDITYSQEMLHDLSVQETQAHVYLELDQEFTKILNDDELNNMIQLNMTTIPLSDVSSPVVIGRDKFKVVFGEQIRKASTSLLSRKHCLFHVSKMGGNGPSGYSVSVENTSTNGIEVNGEPVPRGRTKSLACGDAVTLLRLPQSQALSNLAIRYTLFDESSPDPIYNHHVGRLLVDEISVTSENQDNMVITEDERHAQNVSLVQQTNSGESFRCSVMLAHSILTDTTDTKFSDFRDELHLMLSPILSHGYIQVDYDTATETALEKAVQTTDLVILAESTSTSQMQQMQGMTYNPLVKHSLDRRGIILVNENGLPETLENTKLREICQAAAPSKLIVVLSEDSSCAKSLFACGIPRVIYATSKNKYRRQVGTFIRILIGGILHEFSMKMCFENAKSMAFEDSKTKDQSFDQVELFSTFNDHTAVQTEAKQFNTKWETIVKQNFVSLSSFVLPDPPERLVDRNQEIAEIVNFIRTSPARVCNLHGQEGIGKSTIAIHVAKYISRMVRCSQSIQYISLGDYERNILTEQDVTNVEATYDFNVALLNQLHSDIEELNTAVKMDDSSSRLLILDGCDFYVEAPICDFVSEILRQFPSMKIITTSRNKLPITSQTLANVTIGLEIHSLTEESAAKLLIAYCEEPIVRNKLKKSSADWQSDDMITVIQQHPAVKRLRGNPSLLRQLAREMPTKAMDELI